MVKRVKSEPIDNIQQIKEDLNVIDIKAFSVTVNRYATDHRNDFVVVISAFYIDKEHNLSHTLVSRSKIFSAYHNEYDFIVCKELENIMNIIRGEQEPVKRHVNRFIEDYKIPVFMNVKWVQKQLELNYVN